MEADTVTISKDYLKQLLCQRIQSSEEQPNEDSTHIVLDHTQIPGLEKHSVTISDNDIEQDRMEEYSVPISQYSPKFAESYHRGTLNRPVHPAMRSNIVFGNATDYNQHSNSTI